MLRAPRDQREQAMTDFLADLRKVRAQLRRVRRAA
jgi:hypothetical protein